ncbi:protein RKD4-like [Carex rostrata]
MHLEEMKKYETVIDQKDVKVKNKNGERRLSLEEISRYFDMPIEAAAGELNMCVTSLKGNCRELGLKRWPHQKIKSLQNLIKYIQEQGKQGILEETLVSGQVQNLEKEIQFIKNNPDTNLTNGAKKMRQNGYKDTHKKKKLELIDASNHA